MVCPAQAATSPLRVPTGGNSLTSEQPPVSANVPERVLLLEDNIIILIDTEEVLKELGVSVVATATSCKEALAILDRTPIDYALLDVDLGFETCFQVAERLQASNIQFAFVTGYGDSHPIPPQFADHPRVLKPHTLEALSDVLTKS